MAHRSPLRIALLGAGTFARKAHVPSLLALPDRFQIVAVCSRTRASAEAVAQMLPAPVAIHTDVPALLARDDVDAVDVILPIPELPDAVQMCLAAGKHVVSEKPIAPTLERARALIDGHAPHAKQVWMVAENWRYEDAFQAAGQAIQAGAIGRPLVCDWSLQLPVMPGAPNHQTVWRRTGTFPGGFLLDGGVHHVAGFRVVLGEIEAVSAAAAAHRPDLPPADTLCATLRFANGVVGSYSVTYAARSGLGSAALHVVGSEGSLRVDAVTLTLWREGEQQTVQTFPPHHSVERELAAFADAVLRGKPHRNSAQEALQDLAVVESMLAAAESGRRVSVPVISGR